MTTRTARTATQSPPAAVAAGASKVALLSRGARKATLRALRNLAQPRTVAAAAGGGRPRLLLWPDTFTDHFDPAVAADAVAVLETLGYAVELPPRTVCCGLTWTTTGQVDAARRVLRRSLRERLSGLPGVDVDEVRLSPSPRVLFMLMLIHSVCHTDHEACT